MKTTLLAALTLSAALAAFVPAASAQQYRLIDPASGFMRLSAEGIDDLGGIVGRGNVGGLTHAHALQAAPEPQEPAVMLAGLVGLGFVLRRRNGPAAKG